MFLLEEIKRREGKERAMQHRRWQRQKIEKERKGKGRQVREGEAKEVPSNAAGGGNEKEGKGLRDAAASGDQKRRRKG